MEFIVVTEASSNLPRILSIKHIASIFGTTANPPKAAFVLVGQQQPIVTTHTAQAVLTAILAAGIATDLRDK